VTSAPVRGTLTIDEQFADRAFPSPWTVEGLREAGWDGLVPLLGLNAVSVTTDRGVYVVARRGAVMPEFSHGSLQRGAFHPISADLLRSRWVPYARILYIGQTGSARGLRGRLRPFASASASHSGGRAIWQLRDRAELLVAWTPTPTDVVPQLAEAALLSRFRRDHGGRLPFANAVK
jgi:hypothetical protein